MSKENDLIYGLMREKKTAKMIEKAFGLTLLHTKYNYSLFDYYDDKQTYLFEIKNYRYAYKTYNTEIIGCNKGVNNNLLMIFRHEDQDEEIYFIQYNDVLFKTFNTRYITYRGNNTLCYDIPKAHITKLEKDKQYTLINNEGAREAILTLINEDEKNYKKYKK